MSTNNFASGVLSTLKPGKPVGVCVVCGRVLTDPDSIANKMGPECASKSGFTAEELNGDGEPSQEGSLRGG